MTNMTYAVALETAINAVEDEVVKEKLEALKAQLAKRGSSKTPTKAQRENVGIKEDIISALGDLDHPVTVTELISSDEKLSQFKPQKISALLTQLKEDQRVVRTMDKKKALYALA